MSSSSCPSADDLQAFALGNLSEAAFAQVADHLQHCRQCERLLQAFDGHCDGLITSLRHPRDADLPRTEVPQELLTAAMLVASANANGTAPELSIDSGRRYARQLAQGDCR